jgi:hypothetical protein
VAYRASGVEVVRRPAETTAISVKSTDHVSQPYPIYEAPFLFEIGIEKFFWELGIDLADVERAPAVRL